MTRPISSVSLPANVPAGALVRSPLSAPLPLELPSLHTPGAAGGPRLSIAVLDAGGRLQDRGAVAALGWSVGDRLLITLVQTSVVIHRRADGVFVMPRKRPCHDNRVSRGWTKIGSSLAIQEGPFCDGEHISPGRLVVG